MRNLPQERRLRVLVHTDDDAPNCIDQESDAKHIQNPLGNGAKDELLPRRDEENENNHGGEYGHQDTCNQVRCDQMGDLVSDERCRTHLREVLFFEAIISSSQPPYVRFIPRIDTDTDQGNENKGYLSYHDQSVVCVLVRE